MDKLEKMQESEEECKVDSNSMQRMGLDRGHNLINRNKWPLLWLLRFECSSLLVWLPLLLLLTSGQSSPATLVLDSTHSGFLANGCDNDNSNTTTVNNNRSQGHQPSPVIAFGQGDRYSGSTPSSAGPQTASHKSLTELTALTGGQFPAGGNSVVFTQGKLQKGASSVVSPVARRQWRRQWPRSEPPLTTNFNTNLSRQAVAASELRRLLLRELANLDNKQEHHALAYHTTPTANHNANDNNNNNHDDTTNQRISENWSNKKKPARQRETSTIDLGLSNELASLEQRVELADDLIYEDNIIMNDINHSGDELLAAETRTGIETEELGGQDLFFDDNMGLAGEWPTNGGSDSHTIMMSQNPDDNKRLMDMKEQHPANYLAATFQLLPSSSSLSSLDSSQDKNEKRVVSTTKWAHLRAQQLPLINQNNDNPVTTLEPSDSGSVNSFESESLDDARSSQSSDQNNIEDTNYHSNGQLESSKEHLEQAECNTLDDWLTRRDQFDGLPQSEISNLSFTGTRAQLLYCLEKRSQTLRLITTIITPILFSTIILVGLVGNIAVILVILEDRKTERELSPPNLLILDLSLADLSFIIFCIPFTGWDYAVGHWVFGPFWCKLNQYLIVVCALSSIYTLVLMSVDRFMAVVYPIQCIRIRTSQNTLYAITIKWIIILLVSMPAAQMHGLIEFPGSPQQQQPVSPVPQLPLSLQNMNINNINNQPTDNNISNINNSNNIQCRFLKQKYNAIEFQIIFFIASYLFPLCLIFFLYMGLLQKLWFGNKPMGHRESSKMLESKKKVTWLVAGIVIVFAICWCPIQVMLIMMRLELYDITVTYITIQVFAHILGYMNSCVNPIVYAFASENFNNSFKRSKLGHLFRSCTPCIKHTYNDTSTHIITSHDYGSRLHTHTLGHHTNNNVNNTTSVSQQQIIIPPQHQTELMPPPL